MLCGDLILEGNPKKGEIYVHLYQTHFAESVQQKLIQHYKATIDQ